MHNNLLKENIKEVTIGDSVWIAAEAHILKGTYISANSIVAYRATVLGKFEEPNSLVGGFPAKVLLRNVIWHK